MSSGANKLVDKYQYKQNQIRFQGDVEYITAKHVVTKENFTLKKININDKKTYGKYLSLINQMSILKTLNGSQYITKCHKMLKTSNNLYVVFNLIGSNPSLDQYLAKHNNLAFQQKKTIAIQLINVLKLIRNSSLTILQLNPKNIQICKNLQVKLTNLQSFILNDKKINSEIIKIYQKNSYTSPELANYIEQINNQEPKEIQGKYLADKFQKTDIYSLGKILSIIFKQGKGLFSGKLGQSSQLTQINEIIQKMMSPDEKKRPDIDYIENILVESKSDSRRPKIKIATNNLNVSPFKTQYVNSSSKLTIDRQSSKQTLKISPRLGKNDFDTKSIRSNMSSADLSDASPTLRKTHRKCSILSYEKENFNQELLYKIVLKIIKRRNLCKLLLKYAKILLQIQFLDQSITIMLAFLLIKKSVLLICSLARYLSTGKGQIQTFTFKQSLRKQFSKTEDYQKLQLSIKNQMNLARQMFVSCGKLIQREKIKQINSSDQYNFQRQFASETISEQTLKALVKKVTNQIVFKINAAHKPPEIKRKNSKNFLNTSSSSNFNELSSPTLNKSANKFLQVDDFNGSIRSTNTLNASSRCSAISSKIQTYDNKLINKFLSHQQICYIYLMSEVLDYENYQQLFEKNVNDQEIKLENFQLIRNVAKLDAKQIALSLQQIVV